MAIREEHDNPAPEKTPTEVDGGAGSFHFPGLRSLPPSAGEGTYIALLILLFPDA